MGLLALMVCGFIAWYLDGALRDIKELKSANELLTAHVDALTEVINEAALGDNPIREADMFVDSRYSRTHHSKHCPCIICFRNRQDRSD